MSNSARSGGMSLPLVLFIVFLVLKLTNLINWSWLWVTAPLWIPVGLAVGILALVTIVMLLSGGKVKITRTK
jgi:hypothetical protein